MTQEQRNNLGQILGAMGVMFGRNDLTPPVLSMYLDDLEAAGLSFDQAVLACTRYRRDKKNTRFPLPAQLIEVVRPQADPKVLAIDIARRIDKAVAKHGWNWEHGFFHGYHPETKDPMFYFEAFTNEGRKAFWTFKEAVIAELGEIAWHAICSRGGWQAVRESCNAMPEGMFIAQLRDQIEASVHLARSGVDVTRISLPPPRSESKGLQSAGELMKVLDFRPKEDEK